MRMSQSAVRWFHTKANFQFQVIRNFADGQHAWTQVPHVTHPTFSGLPQWAHTLSSFGTKLTARTRQELRTVNDGSATKSNNDTRGVKLPRELPNQRFNWVPNKHNEAYCGSVSRSSVYKCARTPVNLTTTKTQIMCQMKGLGTGLQLSSLHVAW